MKGEGDLERLFRTTSNRSLMKGKVVSKKAFKTTYRNMFNG